MSIQLDARETWYKRGVIDGVGAGFTFSVIILAAAYVFASYKWIELRDKTDQLEQRTAWMCRLPIAGPNNMGKLVVLPPENYNGKDQVKLEGCPETTP